MWLFNSVSEFNLINFETTDLFKKSFNCQTAAWSNSSAKIENLPSNTAIPSQSPNPDLTTQNRSRSASPALSSSSSRLTINLTSENENVLEGSPEVPSPVVPNSPEIVQEEVPSPVVPNSPEIVQEEVQRAIHEIDYSSREREVIEHSIAFFSSCENLENVM